MKEEEEEESLSELYDINRNVETLYKICSFAKKIGYQIVF
jgi:hypothetical protein